MSSTCDSGLSLADLAPGRARHVVTPWGPFALFLVDGDVLCVQAFCPHMDGPLFEGTVSQGTITCPWHLWRYDLRTGKRADPAGLLDRRCLERLLVRTGPGGSLLLERPG